MTTHYTPTPAGAAACGLLNVPAERLTADLDVTDCGNCLSSRAWRNDISQRNYKRDFERFYGPGGFLDRSGQTRPASATTAPQARAALEQMVTAEVRSAARRGREGAGDDVIAVIVRESVRTVMGQADALLRLAIAQDRTELPF